MATDKEQSILTEAQGLVHGDRNSDYGHPLDDFSRTAAIWTALLGGKLKDGAHRAGRRWPVHGRRQAHARSTNRSATT